MDKLLKIMPRQIAVKVKMKGIKNKTKVTSQRLINQKFNATCLIKWDIISPNALKPKNHI